MGRWGSPNGLGLQWQLLDADLYVPSLIEGAFKTQASRENGRRGGRPKEKVAA
jgi:hypothetical protein